MAIQIRRGTDAGFEANKSNIVAGEPVVTTDTGRIIVGTGNGTYTEAITQGADLNANSLTVTTTITASGDITSSGNITAANIGAYNTASENSPGSVSAAGWVNSSTGIRLPSAGVYVISASAYIPNVSGSRVMFMINTSRTGTSIYSGLLTNTITATAGVSYVTVCSPIRVTAATTFYAHLYCSSAVTVNAFEYSYVRIA